MADAQPYLDQTVREQLVKALQALYKEQPAKPFTFLSEFFSKLQDTPAAEEKKAQEPQKKQAKKKKKKKPKIEKSDVIFECTRNPDAGLEWPEIEKGIKEIDLNGVMWPKKQHFALVDFVFGMKKMIVMAQIVNAEVPTTTVIVEELLQVKGIGGAEMVSIETAAHDWGNKPKSKKQQQSKKSKKKKGGKAAKAERVVTPELIKKDADAIAIAAREAKFYVAGCSQMDGSGQTNVTPEQLKACGEQVQKKLPEVGIMIVAAGKTQVTVYAYVPAGSALNAADWVGASVEDTKATGDATSAYLVKSCDDDDEFPIKIKDVASSAAFGFLRKAGLLDEGSEDEFYNVDDGEGY